MKQRVQQQTHTHSVRMPTIIGLVLALGGPLVYALFIAPRLVESHFGLVSSSLIGFAVMWLLTCTIVAITRLGEGLPLTSIGLQALSWKRLVLAIGLGLGLSLLVPLVTILVSQINAPPQADGVLEVAQRYPAWLVLAGVLTAGITEEVLFRAYALERLRTLTGTVWPGVILNLAAFVGVHAAGWNVSHIIGVVMPLGIVLTALYLWQRNVIFVAITHIMIDVPLVFLALGAFQR